MNGLSGRYVLLTGGSRGIGPVIAAALARRGAHLALAARSADGLRDTCDSLRSYGVRTLAVPVDLADATERQRLANRVLNEFGRIDVLVSNAALETEGAFVQTPWPALHQTIEVNVAAPIHLTLGPRPRCANGAEACAWSSPRRESTCPRSFPVMSSGPGCSRGSACRRRGWWGRARPPTSPPPSCEPSRRRARKLSSTPAPCVPSSRWRSSSRASGTGSSAAAASRSFSGRRSARDGAGGVGLLSPRLSLTLRESRSSPQHRAIESAHPGERNSLRT